MDALVHPLGGNDINVLGNVCHVDKVEDAFVDNTIPLFVHTRIPFVSFAFRKLVQGAVILRLHIVQNMM